MSVSRPVPPGLLENAGAVVTRAIGLHFPSERWDDLARGLANAASTLGLADARALAESLATAPVTQEQIAALAGHLTVGETYFFREMRTLEAIRDHVLPDLIAARRNSGRLLRFWSAGCCSGEEPYSLAILLEKWISDLDDWTVTILATDVNPEALRRAKAGEYGPWSFRATPDALRADPRYFSPGPNGRTTVCARIKERVRFETVNLADDSYPSVVNGTNAMDVILCRNVLMYFSPEQATRAAARLTLSLADGGWLATSASENPHAVFPELSRVGFDGVTLARKGTHPHSASTARPAAPPAQPQPVPLQPTPAPLQPPMPAPTATPASTPTPALSPPFPTKGDPPLLGDATADHPSADRAVDRIDEARALYQRGDYEAARAMLTPLAVREDAPPEIFALLARTEANQGRLEDAAHWGRRTVASNRMDPAGHYLLALILEELGDEVEAASCLRSALYLDPDYLPAHVALGGMAERQGRAADARRHVNNALVLLARYDSADVLPAFEGMTAGRMGQILRAGGLIKEAV